MVEYNEWVSIVFDVADSKGYEASFDANQPVVKLAAEVWNDRTSELRTASGTEAKRIARNEVQVA